MSRSALRLAAPLLLGCAIGVCPLARAAPLANTEHAAARGRPTVVLDRLEMPPEVSKHFERHLRQTLRRVARRADWGAGRENRIEYRFKLELLDLAREGTVVRVKCTAVGQLPRGRSARSQLVFSGDAAKQDAVVERVLDIVARGVVTRLAELERNRRSAR
jgi:hypothetical protein